MTGQTNLAAIACPVCTSQSAYHSIDNEYVRCGMCGMVRTKYSYDPSIYGADYALNYMQYTKSPSNTPLNLFRVGLISRWLREGDRILDVGCCVGEFLRFAEPYYTCTGFEPNLQASDYAKQRCNAPVLNKFKTLPVSYDCITMFDVLEHIEDPMDFLSFLGILLEDDGIIALTTPNVHSVQNHGELRGWKHYKPKEHLFLHTELSLTYMFENLGFEKVHVGYEESDIRPGNPNKDIMTFVARRKSE